MRRSIVGAALVGLVVIALAGFSRPAGAERLSGPATPAQGAPLGAAGGVVGVTVGVVSFTERDGLAAALHAGHHYRTELMLVVSPGYEGATATMTVQPGTVDGCVAVPLPTGVAVPMRCRIELAPHPPGQAPPPVTTVTVTVRLPDGSSLTKVYPHAAQRTRSGQG